MRSARGIASLVLAVAMATGCTDTTNPAASVTAPAIAPPQTSAHYMASGPQDAPEGASGEWTEATSITVEAAAGFRYDAVNPDENVPGNVRSYAWGQTIVRYFANEADAGVTLIVRKDGSIFGQEQAQEGARHWIPAQRSLFATTQLAVQAPCGYSAEAKASGAAWNRAIIPPVGWMEWGRKSDTDVDPANQPACQAGAPGGAGSDGPGGGDRSACGWFRDYVVYTDMSWEFTTPWYHSCGVGGELSLTPDGPTEIMQNMASLAGGPGHRGAPLRLTLVGTRRAANGRIVTIERNAKSKADAVITVDVTRATAADLEEAFVAAEGLSLKAKPKDARSSHGRIVSEPSLVSHAASGQGSRAAKNLGALLRAGDRGKNGDGARIEVVVDRR